MIWDVFGYAFALYALISLVFLGLTLREQRLNRVPWSGTIIGVVLGLIWPVTVVAVLAVTLRTLVGAKLMSKRPI